MRLVRRWIHWCRTEDHDNSEVLVLAGGVVGRLNPVAGWVWEVIEDARDMESLFRWMRRRYRGVTDRTLSADLESLIEGWRRSGWIVPRGDPVFLFDETPWPL